MPHSNEWHFCPHCGSESKPGRRFCVSCGQPLASNDLSIESETETTPEEAAGIFSEMSDAASFSAKCINAPDEVLGKIAKFLKINPDAEDTAMVLIYRFLSMVSKGKYAYESNGCTFVPTAFESCTKALGSFKRTREVLIRDNCSELVPVVEASLEEAAVLLEKNVPGKVQDILGETKLKYLALGDRLSIHNSVQNRLTTTDLQAIGDLWITALFNIRSALLGAFLEQSDGGRVYVSLYDQAEVWDLNGNMNPVRASVWAVKRNETGGHWIIEKQP